MYSTFRTDAQNAALNSQFSQILSNLIFMYVFNPLKHLVMSCKKWEFYNRCDDETSRVIPLSFRNNFISNVLALRNVGQTI